MEENARLKVLYGSRDGFHAIDLDSASIYDVYAPQNVSEWTMLMVNLADPRLNDTALYRHSTRQ